MRENERARVSPKVVVRRGVEGKSLKTSHYGLKLGKQIEFLGRFWSFKSDLQVKAWF